ncbi:MAG TPA: bifunctional oligoribonuclease/PAP phosphatase NrnA [Isosphaeraceae bacterium]|nr:bifunctional oligoribonuclease/PAP phosphatase NrnA [Isosphaeraceae bacterium]
MTIDWTPLADLIETNDRFLVTTHVRPDGDALGSEVGMAGLLRQKGKDVRVVNASPTPPRYDFLDPDSTLFEHFGHKVQPEELADRQVAVILDLSSWNQLGDMASFIRQFPGSRVVVDHHVSEDDLGARVFKDSTAEATGILVMKAIAALGGSLTPEVANALLTAIAMDTGWFRHSNTRSRTLRAAAELVDAGAKVDGLYRQLFERNTLSRVKLMGETLGGMKTDLGGKIAYATISKDDLHRTKAIPPDSEDLVDFTVSLRGVEVGMLFIEQARGGVKVSFRARNGLDCSLLAAKFGGGGHREAAGATISGTMPEVVDRVLETVRKAVG